MKQRRDAVSVPAASPASSPRPAPALPAAPLLARTARPRPVRHVRGGFVLPGVSGVPHGPSGYQHGLGQAAVRELAAAGKIVIEIDHGSDLAGRMDDFRVQQAIEQAVRQRIVQGGFQR